MVVEPARGPIAASVTPPGSKSLTCRAYLLAALAEGVSRIERPLRSDDTDRLLAAIETLGVAVRREGDDVVIDGVAGRFPRGGRVDLGDGGTPARFMLAAACLAAEAVVVDGSPRMRQRPVAELVAMLRRLGAAIEHLGEAGQLPVRVTPPAERRGGVIDVGTTASSQFVSALLLVGPHLPGGLTLRHAGVVTSRSYVDLTVDAMRRWGVDVSAAADGGGLVHRVPFGRVTGRGFAIEPDASSAVYWWIAGLLVPGSVVRVPGIPADSLQPDLRVLDLLGQRGPDCGSVDRVGDELVARAGVARRPLGDGVEVDASFAPDGAMALAVFAAAVDSASSSSSPEGPTRRPLTSRIGGLRTLRVKESDRIAALAAELRRLGCTVAATDDSISIDPSTRHDRPVVVETYDDHRMAMAFAVLGLARPGISIADPACVRKSYPGFWSDLARLAGREDRA